MISSNQKNLLKGFITQANAHNKFLEEQILWKKRYEELAETSDNDHKKLNIPRKNTNMNKKNGNNVNDDNVEKVDIKQKNDLLDDGKWKHDGFELLHPDYHSNPSKRRLSSTSSETATSKIASKKKKKKDKKKSSKKKKKKG
jgi:hypothetical protein